MNTSTYNLTLENDGPLYSVRTDTTQAIKRAQALYDSYHTEDNLTFYQRQRILSEVLNQWNTQATE